MLLFVAALAFACAGEKPSKPLDVAGQKVYDMRGKVVGRTESDNTLRIDHEAIPGFMEAMTMDYSVRGAEVKALPPDGTRITARLHAANDVYWLTDVKKAP